MLALSDKVILATVILASITAVVIFGRAMYILKVKRAAKVYNRFVHDYYGQFEKPAPVLIIRYQNDYIRVYNRECERIVGKLFFFRKMPLIDDPSHEAPVELFPSTLPCDPTVTHSQQMLDNRLLTKEEIADAADFRFTKKKRERYMKTTVSKIEIPK